MRRLMPTGAQADERGSALMLMPAAVLVLVVLGAIAVDSAVVFASQRRLVATTQAAANDAVGYGFDRPRFTATGERRLDRQRCEQAVVDTLEANEVVLDGPARVEVDEVAGIVTVAVAARAPQVFSAGVPGGADDVAVTATATARLNDR